jgi:EAL domain-containing protein (putative c-di-GMP-specific phosphodiesterase class I)
MSSAALGPHHSEGILPSFAIAYQPIVNVPSRRIAAYEALVRGLDGTPYPQVVAGMDAATLRRFHRKTAEDAIRRAVSLGLPSRKASLTINLQPDLDPMALNAEFLRAVAIRYGLPVNRIVLELTEDHRLTYAELLDILNRNKAAGFPSAMDDFGAGYSGLTSLATINPDILKLDRALVSDIDTNQAKQKIVGAFVRVCSSLRIVLIAEGIQTLAECRVLRKLGIKLMQGYFFSRAVIGQLPRFEDCMVGQTSGHFKQRGRREDSGLKLAAIISQTKTA